MRMSILLIVCVIAATMAACREKATRLTYTGPPFIPHSVSEYVGPWCDLVYASTANLTNAGFLVPCDPASLTMSEIVSRGIFYRDIVERERVIRSFGALRIENASNKIQAESQLRRLFADGIQHRLKHAERLIPHQEAVDWSVHIGGQKGALMVKLAGQDSGSSAGFFLGDVNNDFRLPSASWLRGAIFFRDWQEASALIQQSGDGNGIGLRLPPVSDEDVITSFSKEEIPDSVHKLLQGSTSRVR